MVNKVLCIEIGSQITKICLVSFRKKNPRVYSTLVFPTPYDCVEDGYIKDVNTLAATMAKQLRDAKMSVGHVVFTISSSKIANREINLPFVAEKKISEIINANAEDYFPIDIKDYNISYMVMEKINTKEVKNYRLLVLAVHNNLLTTYYELAERLKLKIESIDYVGNSTYQIYQKQVTQGTNMIVQINEQNTMINVIQKNVLELQRIIPYGYDAAVNAVLENPYFKISKYEEAFELLRDKALIQPSFVDNNRYFNQEDVVPVELKKEPVEEITNSLQYLSSNISRVVDYYSSKKPDAKLQTIYLTGMGTKLNGIDLLLANEIGFEVKVIDILQGVTFARSINMVNYTQSDFIACAGATIAPVGMQPAKYALKKSSKNNMVSAATICSLAIMTSCLLWLVSEKTVSNANKESEKLAAQISEMESIDAIYSDNLTITEELSTIKGLESLCYSNNEVLVPLIKELEAKLPSKVVVHSMTAGDSGITINLTANSKEAAAMALIQLKTITYLNNVSTTGISDQKDEYGVATVTFSVIASYSVPDQSEEEIK